METTTGTTSVTSTTTIPVELHPRKRKMKPNKEAAAPAPTQETLETATVSEIHPHEQPITNCYQLYLNIRKQVIFLNKPCFYKI